MQPFEHPRICEVQILRCWQQLGQLEGIQGFWAGHIDVTASPKKIFQMEAKHETRSIILVIYIYICFCFKSCFSCGLDVSQQLSLARMFERKRTAAKTHRDTIALESPTVQKKTSPRPYILFFNLAGLPDLGYSRSRSD